MHRMHVAALPLLLVMASATQGEEYPRMKITEMSRSPHAAMDSVPVNAVRLTDGLWAPRMETNRRDGIPHQYAECERTGRIDNFRRAAGLPLRHGQLPRTLNWGIKAVDTEHPIFKGIENPVMTVSDGLPTREISCYWDDPEAMHGKWLAEWEVGGGKYVCAEYPHGQGKVIFVGTGAFHFDTPPGENRHRANLERLTGNILQYLGAGAVGFVGPATDPECAAALACVQNLGNVVTLDSGLASIPEGVQVLWWHLTETDSIPAAARDEAVVAAVRGFVAEGGGLLLSGFAPAYLGDLGLEPVPPTSIRQRKSGGFAGIFFNDSDVHKWAEAAAISLASHPDRELDALLDGLIDLFARAQEEDGYLDTYYTFDQVPNRWSNLGMMHELYIGGHMIQAAVAHHRATGKDNYLEVARKWADLCCRRFGPGKERGTPGHPEVELALVELYRETGEQRYLDLARFFVEERGHGVIGGGAYFQDHLPIREQITPTGHAVRQLYLNSGVVDIYAETGDASLLDVALKQWDSFTNEKLYITGAAGARREGEAFGDAFELPNAAAYAETCASIASVMWNWRLLQVTGEARYADLMEQTLYNGVLSGVGLDGKLFFYDNPLEVDGTSTEGTHHTCRRTSRHWDGCACCPPNVARTLASMPGYLYGVKDDNLYVHHYVDSTASIQVGGQAVEVIQRTRYPWDGAIEIEVNPAQAARFSIQLRLPGWAQFAALEINGVSIDIRSEQAGSYIAFPRQWNPGDTIRLGFPMPVRKLRCDPRVVDNRGKLALMRGPVVYCIEAVDYPDVPLFDVSVKQGDAFLPEWREDLPGGTTVLAGRALVPDHAHYLYEEMESPFQGLREISFVAVPVHLWANRAPGAMRVWIPYVGG